MARRFPVKEYPSIEIELSESVAKNYEVRSDKKLPPGIPNEFNGKPVEWLANVNVILRTGKQRIDRAQFKIILPQDLSFVYFKGGVKELSSGTALPVGDPPIGIIR
jgi:hypothetical protein